MKIGLRIPWRTLAGSPIDGSAAIAQIPMASMATATFTRTVRIADEGAAAMLASDRMKLELLAFGNVIRIVAGLDRVLWRKPRARPMVDVQDTHALNFGSHRVMPCRLAIVVTLPPAP